MGGRALGWGTPPKKAFRDKAAEELRLGVCRLDRPAAERGERKSSGGALQVETLGGSVVRHLLGRVG